MCWKTSDRINLIMKTADKPLKTYKVVDMLNGTYRAYFRSFEYEPNKVYNEELQDFPVIDQEDGFLSLSRGFHSYFGNLAVCVDDNRLINIRNREDERKWLARYDSYVIIAECTLPEGTRYYVNEDNEVISDRIIVTDNVVRMTKPELLNTESTFEELFAFDKRNA